MIQQFCHGCGERVAEGATFCGQCGRRLPGVVEVSTAKTARLSVPRGVWLAGAVASLTVFAGALAVMWLGGAGDDEPRLTGNVVRTTIPAGDARMRPLPLDEVARLEVVVHDHTSDATVEMSETAPPESAAPPGYRVTSGVRVEVTTPAGEAPAASGVLRFTSDAVDAVVLHQIGSIWEPLFTVSDGATASAEVSSFSDFALIEREPGETEIRGIEPPTDRCVVIGFTGYNPANRRNRTETAEERAQVNDASGVGAFIEYLEAAGVVEDARVFRWYEEERAQATEMAQRAAADGHRVVLVGHSAGGAAALTTAHYLDLERLPVAGLVELDTYVGGGRVGRFTTTQLGLDLPPWGFDAFGYAGPIPENVGLAINRYQEVTSWYHGRRHLGADMDLPMFVEHGALDDEVAAGNDIENGTTARDAIVDLCAEAPASEPQTEPGGSEAALRAAMEQSTETWNTGDWESYWNDLLSVHAQQACPLGTFVEEINNSALNARFVFGSGRFAFRNAKVEMVGTVATVTGQLTIGDQVAASFTSANPWTWLYLDDAWREISILRDEGSPCYNIEDLRLVRLGSSPSAAEVEAEPAPVVISFPAEDDIRAYQGSVVEFSGYVNGMSEEGWLQVLPTSNVLPSGLVIPKFGSDGVACDGPNAAPARGAHVTIRGYVSPIVPLVEHYLMGTQPLLTSCVLIH